MDEGDFVLIDNIAITPWLSDECFPDLVSSTDSWTTTEGLS